MKTDSNYNIIFPTVDIGYKNITGVDENVLIADIYISYYWYPGVDKYTCYISLHVNNNKQHSYMPGTAAGTVRERHLTVAAALSSGENLSGQSTPGSTILVLRRLPSRYTW